jgi:hypothetical protein
VKLIERVHLKWMKRLLKQTDGNKKLAAAQLGVSLRTWHNWELNLGMRTIKREKVRA